MSLTLSLTELSVIALAKAALEPIPEVGPTAEAVSYVLYSLPRKFRLQLALGEFGPFTSHALQRHPVFDVEFGLAARTLQRFYRGHRIRRYLEVARSGPLIRENLPGQRSRRRDFSIKALFEIAPPGAFIKRAAVHPDNPGSLDELLEIQEQWAGFLENDATGEERAAFGRFAQELVVARLDRVHTIQEQLHRLGASTLAGVPTTREFLPVRDEQKRQSQEIGDALGLAAGLSVLCVTSPVWIPLSVSSTVEYGIGLTSLGAAALLSQAPILWPAALIPLWGGIFTFSAGAVAGAAACGTGAVPFLEARRIASVVGSGVADGVQTLLPSPARANYLAQRRRLSLELDRLRKINSERHSTDTDGNRDG